MLLKPEIETEKTSDSTNGQDDEKSVDDSLKDSYHQLGNFDGDKRAPEYSCAGTPGMWEVPLLRMHYHPSVQSFVKSFSSTETNHVITYPGDPTVDFSLSSFLNRFSYKNPKKRQFANGNHRSISLQLSEAPVNSSEFINLSYEEVSPDKEFFHRFFNTQINLRNSGKSRFKRGKDDDDSDGSDASDYDEFGSDIDGGDDDEAEMDKFADKLANDLMEKEDDVDIDDDDDDMEDFDAEVSDGSDSDNEAFDEPENEDLDFADYIKSQKKNKRQMQESDDDDEVEVFVSDKKAQKTTLQNKRKYESLPTSKKQQKSSMSAFASYEDYEEEMDNIMNQQKMKNGKSSASNTSNQPITSKKGNSNKFAKNK
jgi:ribosome biogenesis protein MAK21